MTKGLNKTMWKPTPGAPGTEPQRTPAMPTSGREETMTPTASAPTPQNNMRNTVTPSSAVMQPDQATIGKSLIIKGEVTGSESLYIDGRVEGSINLNGHRVTVGRNGIVNANITAREVVVQGKLKGNITASDRVDIRNEGSLSGDVIAQRISIEDGAFFKGGIDIRKPGQKMEPQNANTKQDHNHAATA